MLHRFLSSTLLLAALPALAAAEIPITGRVLGPEGEARPGVEVSLESIPAGYERARLRLLGRAGPDPVDRAQTGGDGAFALAAPEIGMWKVVVTAPGHLTMEHRLLPLIDARELPALELKPAAALEVRLVDAGGGPRPGVVGAYTRGVRGNAWRPQLRLARAADDGVARLPLGRDETIRLEVLADGHPLLLADVADERSVHLELPAGVRRTVRITGAEQRPLPGAVAFQGSGLLPLGLADAEGRMALVLAAPTLKVATADRWHGAFELDLEAGVEKEELVEDLRLEPPATLRGRIFDLASRDPVPGALVWEVRGEPAVTDGRGRYALELGAYRSRVVWAAAAGYLPGDGAQRDPASGEGPAIALAPAAQLRGRVVDEERSPLPGVALELTLSPRGGRFGGNRPWERRSATSSRRGTFDLSGLAAGVAYRITATKPGFAPLEVEVGALEPAERRSGLEVVLRAGRRAVGRVVDESDAPVAGAEVTLRAPPPADARAAAMMMARQGEDEAGGPATTTDAEGSFEIGDLAPGRYDLDVRARGFAPATVPGLRLDEEVGEADFGTVVLVPGAAIEGRVADPDGRPVAGAAVTVHAQREGLMGLGARPGPQGRVETGADGRFVVADLLPDQPLTLAIAKEGYGTEAIGSVRPAADPIAVVLRPAGRLSGRVVDSQGDAIAGAHVTAHPDHRSMASASGAMMQQFRPTWAKSDADGRFLIEGVEPGTLTVSARAETYQQVMLSGVELEPGTEREIEIVLEAGAVVEGRVTTADGLPVVGASIHVAPRRDAARGISGLRIAGGDSAMTDAEGRYRVAGAPVGPASIQVFHNDRQRLTKLIEVRPGGNVVDLVFEPGFEVSGQVVDGDGNPVGGAALALQPGLSSAGLPGSGFNFEPSPPAVSGADGLFTLTDVAAGSYRLAASREGFAAATSEDFEVADDVAGLLLELGRGATLKGRILGLEFDELGSLTLFAHNRTGGMRRGQVDFEARYAFDALVSGEWYVLAQVGSSGRMTTVQVEIPEGATEVEEDIEFESGFALSGVVIDGGEPLAGATVTVAGSMASQGQATADAAGRFRLDGLKAGSYQVLVMSGPRVQHHEPLELVADQEIRIEILTGNLSGFVRDAADGEPLAGAVVVLQSLEAGDGSIQSLLRNIGSPVESDSRGFFTVPRLRQGSWRLVATLPGYAPGEATVTVAGGTAPEVEIRMAATEGVSFEVVLQSGMAVPAVGVVLLDPAGRRLTGGSYPVVDGRVKVSTVPPGRWELVVQAVDSAAARVAVTSPGDQGRVVLPTGGELHLRVPELEEEMMAIVVLTGPDGKPFVSVAGAEWGLAGGQQLMSAGRAIISGLAPGPWSFTVTHADGRTWSGSATVTPGSTTEVSLP